jgi:hypothetical protein
MKWDEGECREVKVTKPPRKRGFLREITTYSIPAPYHRIVSQLACEEAHAEHHNSHESYRRQAYALRVLDEFAKELLEGDPPTASFRSRVLTPILQRQLMGVHDAYTPSVRRAIADGDGEPTITDATTCYLSLDPVDPTYIPYYRHHLLYLPEARWHLGVIMDPSRIGNAVYYNMVRANHDSIMQEPSIDAEDTGEPPSTDKDDTDEPPSTDAEEADEPPPLTREEVRVVLQEDLAEFFQPELDRVVSPCDLPGPVPN